MGSGKAIRAFSKVESPYEIINQTSSAGRLLWKRYEKVYREYSHLQKQALQIKPDNGLWVFIYKPARYSLTRDLADEMTFRFPNNILILGREKSGEYRCSLRSTDDIPLLTILKRALVGIHGYGGGHMQACGAAIKVEDFERFLNNIKEELSKIRA